MFSFRNCFKFCENDRRKKKENRLVMRRRDVFNEVYLKEMRYGVRDVGLINKKFISKRIPKHLFQKCMWFAITLFLKQSKSQTKADPKVDFSRSLIRRL